MARRRVDLDDLLDADDVAVILGLSSGANVRRYRSRYRDFPSPVLPRKPGGKGLYWLRQDIEAWREAHPPRPRAT